MFVRVLPEKIYLLGEQRNVIPLKRPWNIFHSWNITLQNIYVIKGKSMYLWKSDHLFILLSAAKH